MPKKVWNEEKVKHLERLVEEGKSSSEIGNILGTTADAVRQKMHREGIKRGNRGQNSSKLSQKQKEEDIANRIRKLKGEDIEIELPEKTFSDKELKRFIGQGFSPQKVGGLKRRIWEYISELNSELKWDGEVAKKVLGCNLFAQEVLDEELQDFQLAMVYLMLSKRRSVFVMGRQVGKDFTISVFSLWMAIVNTNYEQLIVSNSQRASDELYDRILGFVARSDELSGSVQESNKEKMVFKNKSRIIPLPSTGRIRGYTEVDRIYCNEVAHGFGNDVVENVLEPMLAVKNGYLTLMSTPLGTTGVLYEAFKNPQYAKIQLPTRVNEYIPKDFLEKRKASTSNITYQSEYEAQFMDAQNVWLNSKNVDKASEEYDFTRQKEEGKKYYAGVDWGRVRDSSVVVVVSKDKADELKVEYLKSFDQTPAKEVVNHIVYLNSKFNLQKVVSEYTGLGIEPTERLEDEVETNVERFKSTVQGKLKAYEELRSRFEDGEITIPEDRKLLTELKMLRYENTSSGNVKIHHPEGGSDDHADALCFAVWAARKQTPKLSISTFRAF